MTSIRKFRKSSQFDFIDQNGPMIVDNFAGGGGASTGIELAIGRSVDVAINHNPKALAMHEINHPLTKHYCESVWDVDPVEVCNGRSVALAWFSPDCTHHSKAKGGKPRDKNVRGLAWVVLRWAAKVKPSVIMLENVTEFQDWGPLTRSKKPCKKRKGQTFELWKDQLESLGYRVDTKVLQAHEYGAPTTRKRLFLIARRDSFPIIWPEKTHGNGLKPFRTASEIIDWSLKCPSIFLNAAQGKEIGVKRPLAENTLKRIARGVHKFVLRDAKPFILKSGNTNWNQKTGVSCANKPLSTIVTKAEHYLIKPVFVKKKSKDKDNEGGGRAALISFVAKHYGGGYKGPGASLNQPLSTITTVDHHALVQVQLKESRKNQTGDQSEKMGTVADRTEQIYAFLIKYYRTGSAYSVNVPIDTITTNDRMAVVTVKKTEYELVDIGMRMLQPHELYAANSFPDDFIHEFEYNGKPLSKTDQVMLCGNSVPPVFAEELVRENIVKFGLLETETLINKRE